jgi:hypothetical protein
MPDRHPFANANGSFEVRMVIVRPGTNVYPEGIVPSDQLWTSDPYEVPPGGSITVSFDDLRLVDQPARKEQPDA